MMVQGLLLERDESGQLSLWIGREKQTGTATVAFALADTDEPFRVGALGNVEGEGMYFVGRIDEVRLSKSARGTKDELGNVAVDYVYNARNQLVTETSGTSVKSYSYDRNGNTTSIVETVGEVEVAIEEMTYNELNRMTSYAGPRGSESFAYRGAEWHRFSADGVGFLYDGDNVLADVSGANIETFYVTPFIDQNLSLTKNAATYYYSQDGLGSVRILTNAAGAPANRYDHTAFGSPYVRGSAAAVDQRYMFMGRERSVRSELMHYRTRVYWPGGGLFLSRNRWGHIHRNASLYDAMNQNPILYRELFSAAESTAVGTAGGWYVVQGGGAAATGTAAGTGVVVTGAAITVAAAAGFGVGYTISTVTGLDDWLGDVIWDWVGGPPLVDPAPDWEGAPDPTVGVDPNPHKRRPQPRKRGGNTWCRGKYRGNVPLKYTDEKGCERTISCPPIVSAVVNGRGNRGACQALAKTYAPRPCRAHYAHFDAITF